MKRKKTRLCKLAEVTTEGQRRMGLSTVNSSCVEGNSKLDWDLGQLSESTIRQQHPSRLVPEMPYPGKDHRHSVTVGGFDDFLVADGAARLNDGRRARLRDFFHAVGEREESV